MHNLTQITTLIEFMQKRITIKKIHEYQEKFGIDDYQKVINDGSVWRMSGTFQRRAMSYLSAGVCFAPLKEYRDFWGNIIPSRTALPKGGIGTLVNSKRFWSDIDQVNNFFELQSELEQENGVHKKLSVNKISKNV